jgi:hypothetical protein
LFKDSRVKNLRIIIIIMLSYRAESSLFNLLPSFYANAQDGRQLLKEIFISDSDLIPDYQKQILVVRLHSLSTPRANAVVKKL